MNIDVEIYEADGIQKGKIVGITAFKYNNKIYKCNTPGNNLGRTPAVYSDVQHMKIGETFTVDDYYKKHPFSKYRSEVFKKGISKMIEDNVLLQIGNFEFKKVGEL